MVVSRRARFDQAECVYQPDGSSIRAQRPTSADYLPDDPASLTNSPARRDPSRIQHHRRARAAPGDQVRRLDAWLFGIELRADGMHALKNSLFETKPLPDELTPRHTGSAISAVRIPSDACAIWNR